MATKPATKPAPKGNVFPVADRADGTAQFGTVLSDTFGTWQGMQRHVTHLRKQGGIDDATHATIIAELKALNPNPSGSSNGGKLGVIPSGTIGNVSAMRKALVARSVPMALDASVDEFTAACERWNSAQ